MKLEVTLISAGMENAYLLTGGERPALVDTLAPISYRKLKKVLGSRGLDVSDIGLMLITHHHSDHAGNAAKIKEASGAVVIAGEADAPVIDGSVPQPTVSDLNRTGRALKHLPDSWMQAYQRYRHVQVDRTVKGGEKIEELGLEVIALPGHTAGGVGFLDREKKRAFIGDLVSCFFGRPGMPFLMASESLEDIFASQELLAGLGLETAYTGHGRVIDHDASKVIGDLSRKKRAKLLR